MKDFFINEHTEHCVYAKKQMESSEYNAFANFCEINPNYFIFSMFNDFVLIKHHKCCSEYREVEFKKGMIEAFLKSQKESYFEVEKSINLNDFLKEKNNKVYGKNLIEEINCIYHDNAKKYYAITSIKVKTSKTIFNKSELEKNYIQSKEELQKIGQPFLLNEIDDLYSIIIDYNNF
jgi:phosphopantetheine adenylyltransferase